MTDPTRAPRTSLQIGAEQTLVSVQSADAPPARLVLAVGAARTARDFFQHTPPTPAEVENAIQAVEDEVMRARALVPPATALHSDDPAIRQLALGAGLPPSAPLQLSLEAVERQFDLLAALVQGRPATLAGIPTDAGFAATLLILREFMHHLQFSAIRLVVPGPVAQAPQS